MTEVPLFDYSPVRMGYADPVAQAEVDRLQAKIARVEAVCGVWETPPWKDAYQQLVRTGHAGQIREALADMSHGG